MEIEFIFTRMDFLKYVVISKLRSLSFWLMAVFSIAFTIIGFQIKGHALGWVFLALIVVVIIYYAVWFLNEIFVSKDSKTEFSKKTAIFGDEAVDIKTDTKTFSSRWDAYSGWWLYSGCYVLGGNKAKNALFIPKRNVKESQVEALEKILNEKIYKLTINNKSSN